MNRTEALERARKLMALGESENEHEAALAMARAQALLERFDIETAELATGAEDPYQSEMVKGAWDASKSARTVMWRVSLAGVIANGNGCAVYYTGAGKGEESPHPRVYVHGRRGDVRRVRALWVELVGEVERLAQRQPSGRGRRWLNSYREGVVAGIDIAMKRESAALRAEMRGTVSESALAVVDTRRKAADAWMRSKTRLRSTSRSTHRDRDGWRAGRDAGADAYGRASRGRVNGGSGGALPSGS